MINIYCYENKINGKVYIGQTILTLEERHIRGKPRTESHSLALSLAQKGKPKSEETKKKMSKARMGKAPWNKGKHK